MKISCYFLEVSCQTVNTYTTKDVESLPCTITGQTLTVIWADTAVENQIAVLTYQKGNPPVINISTEAKYTNFNYALTPTSFNLVIENVEDGDGGVYNCAAFGLTPVEFDVTVEVLVKPTVQYESQDVVELDVIVGTQYNLTCSATRARSVSDLSLMWDPSLVETTPLVITSNDDYKHYSITSTYTAVRGVSSITCQLTGYVMQDEINNQRMDKISHTVILNVQCK
ncbi:hypothetical protein BSL78_10068 [Apostichopus japonicus]|uniref:Ig-like domain-containing protein n=1 Tax=Stichopus japonicus TaxID=307972 RepID=A0A2G8KYG0_STIJA|nr:hypothetical protein BSL78_10068 [Apostichopus japonicus]